MPRATCDVRRATCHDLLRGSGAHIALPIQEHPAGNCTAIVRPNWKLFNTALPRWAPQVVVIAHFEQCLTDEPPLHAGGSAANRRLLEAIDRLQ